MICFCKKTPRKSSNQFYQNMSILRLRLSRSEKHYYTNLFVQFREPNSDKVLFENFPKLLGILGTDIAEDIAQRIFEIFSGNKNFITLQEYLKYIDVYHYGDKNERSNLTCKLMDFNNDGQVTFDEFYKYINLIMGAVRRVNPYLKSELFSRNDIKILFSKISSNKDYFTYDEFFMIYNEKPEIISWIDYFKNDSEDSLLVLNKYIKKIIRHFCNYTKEIINILKDFTKKNFENEKKMGGVINTFQGVMTDLQNMFTKFKEELNLQNEKFMNFAKNNDITLRKLLQILSKKETFAESEEENDINTNMNKIKKKEEENKFYLDKTKSLNVFSNFSDKKEKNINNDSRTNNINMKNSLRMQKIKDFFLDVKNKLNSDSTVNKRNIYKSQSICTKNLFFKNKLYCDKDNIISNFNYEEEKNLKNKDDDSYKKDDSFKKNESSGYTDFILSEDDDEGIIEKNIHTLNNDALFKYKYVQNNENQKINLQSKKLEENKKNFEESTKIKAFNDLNGILIDKSNSIKTNISDKNNQKYKKIIFNLLKYLDSFSKIFFKSMLNLSESYKYIESKYLKKDIINIQRIKKEEAKKNLINKIKSSKKNKENKSQNKKRVSIAVENIPKTKLKTSDDSFKLLLNTIMGIQIAVESSPDIVEVQNINQYLHSMTYSIQTSNISKNKNESFMIKEYAGIVFNKIRRLYNYDKESFIQSISPQVFITEIIISNTTSIEELFNTGSSGSLFYYTRDGKFILKTIDKKEYKTLKRILPKYYTHLIKYKNTFLPKFFGYYKLIRKVKKKKTNFYFIIMMNVFSTKKKIHLRFDLKGSKLGREVLKQKEKNGLNYNNVLGKYNYALKDLDFDFFKKEIHVDYSIRDKIIEQLKIDSQLLKDLNINDYSLLLGIHKKKLKKNLSITNLGENIEKEQHEINSINNAINNDINNNNDNNTENTNSNISNFSFSSKEQESKNDKLTNYKNNKLDFSSERVTISSLNKSYIKNDTEDKLTNNNKINEIKKEECNNDIFDNKGIILEDGGILNEKENEIYYMGIIDILTNYDCVKVGEFIYKSVRYCTKKMSCVSPAAYQERFINYLQQIIPPNYNKNSNEENNKGEV